MPLLTLGSAAFDSIQTPSDARDYALGGSAVYAAVAASFFTKPQLLAIVGGDWNDDFSRALQLRGVDLQGLEVRKDQKTTFWKGRYFDDMNQRETLTFEGNVMTPDYVPFLPDAYQETRYVLLGNGSPVADLALLDKLSDTKLVFADTMDYYIQNTPRELAALLKRVDGLILNDSEAAALTGVKNDSFAAARKILEMGPRAVVVKRGEYGAFWMNAESDIYVVPAYPFSKVVDPTGAGDSFAGAMMGVLAEEDSLDAASVKKALLYATVVAGMTIEGFALEAFDAVDRNVVDARVEKFRDALVC